MINHARETQGGCRKLLSATAEIVALAVPIFLGLMTGQGLHAQAPAGRSPAAQSPATPAPTVPQWQTDAGGKMAFDVASVKPNKSNDPAVSSFPMGPGDAFVPSGGRFSATNQ